MSDALSTPPPALVESIAHLTLATFQLKASREGMKLSARDRAMLVAGAECAVGLTWDAIVKRAERELCTCPDIDVSTAFQDPMTQTVKGHSLYCPVHNESAPTATEAPGITTPGEALCKCMDANCTNRHYQDVLDEQAAVAQDNQS